ncbi:MAG TPA: YidC/Oxa1 family membrane protein insertase [Candidatus Saccharimonadia bacterium]|nr:YidC/Oxa1 family membrane protein insertase [Candidatus Saccharimonadia bacterium]
MNIFDLYVSFIYQPFLNILVGIYWLLTQLPHPVTDMGIAVILFTIVVRILLLPLTISGDKGEHERREIELHLKHLEETHSADPVVLRNETKKLLRKNRKVVISESIDLGIQVILALMLWRIFARGLPGQDLHLIYSWMPHVQQPFNLLFLGKFDLSHPHPELNLLQSLLIMALETLNILTSPYPIKRDEVVRLELVLPVVSFIIFAFLPAGKKLFIITALLFSIGYKLIRIVQDGVKKLMPAPNQEEAEEASTPEKAAAASSSAPGEHAPSHG